MNAQLGVGDVLFEKKKHFQFMRGFDGSIKKICSIFKRLELKKSHDYIQPENIRRRKANDARKKSVSEENEERVS